MSSKTFEDLPLHIQSAVRDALPTGTTHLEVFVRSALPALGNRSIVDAIEQDGYAVESAIIDCCTVLKRMRAESVARGIRVPHERYSDWRPGFVPGSRSQSGIRLSMCTVRASLVDSAGGNLSMSIRIARVAVVVVWCCLAPGVGAQHPSRLDEEAAKWLGDAFLEIETVKVGMTRDQLSALFATEGGLFNGLRRTYVYRRCPMIKIDVEFEPVGRPSRDAEGRVTMVESDQDLIKNISRPYLARQVTD